LTVPDTRTSPGPAKAATRAAMWTASPPRSSPRTSRRRADPLGPRCRVHERSR
jgi:hypothetical protein